MKEILQRVYCEHQRGLFVLALSITRSPADAEDAVHEAFARLCRSPAPAGDAAAYVFAAVRNAALDRVRNRGPVEQAIPSVLPCLDGADHPLAERERAGAIAASIDTLPNDLRMVVFLRIYGGLTFRQIAELTDAPLPTIASRYSAGLEKLRPHLRKWL